MQSANSDTQAAWAYHAATKHSVERIRADPHFLDWGNQPRPFKIYTSLDPIPLPRAFEPGSVAALSALAAGVSVDRAAIPALGDLARILYYCAGITKRRAYRGGEVYFRAAPCTGALYEIELYVVCGELPALPAGVYQFAPHDFALRRLRAGDWRGVLVAATAAQTSVVNAPVIIVCTGTYWRNAWKYRTRSYRHFGWDNGAILANLLAMCTALRLPATLVGGFVDAEVNGLLDIDTRREVAFSLVSLGYVDQADEQAPRAVVPLELETQPLSRTEIAYPELQAIHAASSLHSAMEVRHWRGRGPALARPVARREVNVLQPPMEASIPRDAIEQVIARRGSTRRFARAPITCAQLATMLDRATRGIPADFLEPFGTQLNDLYLIVNAVQGLAPGAYYFRREEQALELLQAGEFRDQAAHLGLQQDLPGDASVDVFFLADLPAILARFGNRGYRAVQLEAGIIGGKLYLSAYAQRLGATGLTFFDDEVTTFFSPHAAGKSAIFLVALGRSARRGSSTG